MISYSREHTWLSSSREAAVLTCSRLKLNAGGLALYGCFDRAKVTMAVDPVWSSVQDDRRACPTACPTCARRGHSFQLRRSWKPAQTSKPETGRTTLTAMRKEKSATWR